MIAGRLRRGVVVAAVLLGSVASVLGATGRPAGADPARPTNYRSRVLSIDPPLVGATVEVQGGDAFVVLSVELGHEAIVPDYGTDGTDRPYLLFQVDGTVKVNESSAAASANESRFGSSPSDFDPESEPRWRTVADDGSYAWHDHRVHLMVPDDMAVVDEQGRVNLGGVDGTWEVPLRVDGVDTVVRGELVRLDAPASWPWYLATALLGAGVLSLLAVASSSPRWLAPSTLLVTAVAATYVSTAELWRAPEGSGPSTVPVMVAGAALAGAAAALGARFAGTRGASVGTAGTALASAALLWWGITRVDVFSHAILPSGLGALDRAATACALGLGMATAAILVWRPALLSPSSQRAEPTDVG